MIQLLRGLNGYGIVIPANYRIPAHSVIHAACAGDDVGEQEDCLGLWTNSRGTALPARLVRVTARGSWAALEPLVM